jgi:hypothetical protein
MSCENCFGGFAGSKSAPAAMGSSRHPFGCEIANHVPAPVAPTWEEALDQPGRDTLKRAPGEPQK